MRSLKVEFLASTDVWFRPCNFANAPDGNLYVTDIYRQVIETPESIPEEIRKKIDFYRRRYDGPDLSYRAEPSAAQRRSEARHGASQFSGTGEASCQPNGWHRETAHRLLLERQDRSVIPALRALSARRGIGRGSRACACGCCVRWGFAACRRGGCNQGCGSTHSGTGHSALESLF